MQEQWRPVVNYEGLYEVSSLGKIRSLSHMSLGRWGKMKLSPGKMLNSYTSKIGYKRLDLCKDGKPAHKLVHRIVAEAFIKPIKGKDCVNHINNDRADNKATNLEWCTHAENTEHARKQGRLGAKSFPSAFKTHCINGHPFDEANTLVRNNHRLCRACKSVLNKRYQNELRAEMRLRMGIE